MSLGLQGSISSYMLWYIGSSLPCLTLSWFQVRVLRSSALLPCLIPELISGLHAHLHGRRIDDHPIFASRLLERHIPLGHVLRHHLRLSLQGIAVAPSTRRVDDHLVARLQLRQAVGVSGL